MKLRSLFAALHAALFALLLAVSPAGSGSMTLLGVGGVSGGGGAYSGPGDSQAFVIWGSVARVYSAALASTSTSMADLVDSAAPTTVICTLRGSSSGLVDLTAYCPGSVTPSAKCAAATGGVCNISKLYDQVGGNNWVQTTAAKQPTLAFSGINSQPSMSFVSANSQTLITGTGVTQGVPFSVQAVAERTGSFTSGQIMSDKVADVEFNFNAASTTAIYAGAGSGLTATATDSAPHVIQGTYNTGTTGTINVDGATQVTGTTGTNAYFGSAHLVCLGSYQDSIQYLTGLISEAGIYGTTYSAGVQSNARTAYGL